MSDLGKFFASTDGEIFNTGPYDTREDAVADAPIELDLEPGEGFAVGVAAPLPSCIPRADRLLETMEERAGDFVPFEIVDGWLTPAKPEELADLQAALDTAVRGWMERHGRAPTFYTMEKITEHVAPVRAEPAAR